MEEKEVIQYLKDNMKKGISFHFMPKEVQDWITKNYRDCAYLNDDGIWDRATNHVSDINDIWASDVYALIEGYEPKPEEPKGEWVEFEINQKGIFRRFMNGEARYFFWANWNAFLTEAYSFGYRAFGGWQYKDCDAWFLTPQIAMQGRFYNLCTKDDNPKPAIPIKIRFWREK
jgi:hypothetical protein